MDRAQPGVAVLRGPARDSPRPLHKPARFGKRALLDRAIGSERHRIRCFRKSTFQLTETAWCGQSHYQFLESGILAAWRQRRAPIAMMIRRQTSTKSLAPAKQCTGEFFRAGSGKRL